MANGFAGGFDPCRPSAVSPFDDRRDKCKDNGFLLLLLLFILLAAGKTWGIDNNFFFIIILAIIAFGGFGRTFGFNGAY